MIKKRGDYLTGYLLLLPAALMSVCVFLVPFLFTVGLSFFDVNFMTETRGFMGFQHYIDFFTSARNQKILWYSFVFLIICLPSIFMCAFVPALLLSKHFKGQGLFRTLNILPWVVANVSAAFMFRWVFNETSVGLVNRILGVFGIEKVFWLSDPKMNFIVIILCVIWKAVPLPLLLLLNGIQAIPDEYYEAVDIDGGGFFIKLKSVTLPFLMGQIRIILVSTTLGLLGGVDVMRTIGGAGDYRVIGYAMYLEAFSSFSLSSAAAIGTIMIIADVLLALVYMKLFKLNETE